MYIDTYIDTYIHTSIHTYIHTSIHTYIHTYIHTCRQTDRHKYIQIHIHAYIHTYIHTDRQTRAGPKGKIDSQLLYISKHDNNAQFSLGTEIVFRIKCAKQKTFLCFPVLTTA